MSEDLPHKSGITTLIKDCLKIAQASEDLPHKSGITTHQRADGLGSFVGRLAPQIGDYDTPSVLTPANQSSRKTCPTNRGLRHGPIFNQGYDFRSEDLPHKSGITTR